MFRCRFIFLRRNKVCSSSSDQRYDSGYSLLKHKVFLLKHSQYSQVVGKLLHSAIGFGGPGRLLDVAFAFLGASTAYVESTLGHKVEDRPAFYLIKVCQRWLYFICDCRDHFMWFVFRYSSAVYAFTQITGEGAIVFGNGTYKLLAHYLQSSFLVVSNVLQNSLKIWRLGYIVIINYCLYQY